MNSRERLSVLLASVAGIALLVAPLALEGQQAPPAQQEVPNRAASRPADPKVEPWMRSQILDKGAIAEDTARRIIGLRESGNPHLPEGSVLAEATPPKLLTDEELDQLRERQINAISNGRQQLNWSTPAASERAEQTRQTAASTPTPTKIQSSQWKTAIFSAGLVLLLLVVHRRRTRN